MSIFAEHEEDEEISEVSVSTSVVSDGINNRNKKKTINKIKVRHEEEDEEEKESDWEDNCSYDNNNNNQCYLNQNEPCQSVMTEHKALEEHVHRLEIKNEEKSYIETMNQCHLALMRNEKQANRKRETCECNMLIEEHNKLNEEMQHLWKNYNVLFVKHVKLIDAYNEVINEMDNDWKQKWKNTKKWN